MLTNSMYLYCSNRRRLNLHIKYERYSFLNAVDGKLYVCEDVFDEKIVTESSNLSFS